MNGLDISAKINGLSLFSGIGGLDFALDEFVRPIAYCEIDTYCQGVLLSRMSDGGIPYAPIWDNVATLQGLPFCGHIDIIYGGFPCQDISIAGNGKGLDGERSGLFYEIVRISNEIRPKFIFLENVPAITTRGGLEVVKEITTMGYDCRWCVISASSVGALHKRERWFLLAHSHSKRCDQGTSKRIHTERQASVHEESSDLCDKIPDSSSERLEGLRQRTSSEEPEKSKPSGICCYASTDEWQETVSSVCRVTDGVPFRMERIKSLGNAVVPAQAKEAFKILMGLK